MALNFLQRLSGVATARAAVTPTPSTGTGCRVLDTRKTTPGLRRLEKMAAAAGGVTNHRMGLFDAILIKNNHIAAAGGVRAAPWSARARAGLPVEIEVRTRAELDEALACGADAPAARQPHAGGGRRVDPGHRRPRQGRTLRRHHARKRPRLRGGRRGFRLLRRHHALGAAPSTSTSGWNWRDSRSISTRARAPARAARRVLRIARLHHDEAARLAADGCARGHGGGGRGADRRAGPPRPRVALRAGRRAVLLHRAAARAGAEDMPVLTLALGLAAAEAIARAAGPRLRPALAQRRDAGRHARCAGILVQL